MFYDRPRKGRPITETNRIRIDALCDDAMFAITKGLFKPNIHLQLAIYLLSHTGSKEVLSVVNRLGKCVSYAVTQGLLTKLGGTFKSTTEAESSISTANRRISNKK
ncbi:hypothetical protein OUZ56_009818 [Daphnia magna]|uniref:Uncharacterized protein n=1 Tax=Daphnia magna TaxID=35525 RepID=A0ABR0AH05_9CRUS|nr:hypothetical protein OUZ56_009816 [Daphnia magna]KAK4024396.1 hypothetical protein OUZ56_009818 [Daphnia magna]